MTAAVPSAGLNGPPSVYLHVAGEQIVRTKKRYQFHAALPAHLDGRERARLNLRPLVVLVNGVEAAREALAAAKANKGRGRPGSIECVKFVFGGPPPLDSPDAWPQDRVAAWMQANVDWVQTCAGPHAVIATVFYYPDERSRYQHLLLIPITDKGRLSWTALERKFALNPKVPSRLILSSMQDRYQQEVGKRFGLERGEIGSRRKHEAINRPKGFLERVLEAPSTRSDQQRAEAALLRAKAADRERDHAVQRQCEAEAERDRALDVAASAEADRDGADEERAQAVVKATRTEAECEDLKRLQSELTRERDEARTDCDRIRDALEREQAEHTAEERNSKAQFREAAIVLELTRRGHHRALRKVEDLRKAAPPIQEHIDAALEHARAADEARVAAEAERDQAIAGRDKARQGYLAKQQQRDQLAAQLVQDITEARQQGYTRGKASRASEVDAAQDRALNLQLELDTLRTRRSAAVQVARREGVAAGRTQRDNQVTALEQKVQRLRTERDDRVTVLKQTVEDLTTQLTVVNQDGERLVGKVKNLTEHCDDLNQQLKEPRA